MHPLITKYTKDVTQFERRRLIVPADQVADVHKALIDDGWTIPRRKRSGAENPRVLKRVEIIAEKRLPGD